MDAEHRHELKTNELATWISNLPEMLKQNSNILIGGALILIGLISWPLLSNRAREKDLLEQSETTNSIQMLDRDTIQAVTQSGQDAQARQQALSLLLVNAESLLEKADKLDNNELAALSRIKGAQAIRTELQLRREEVPAETVETQIKKASDAYDKAFSEAKTPQVKGLAQLGKALCLEELGQTDQASQLYQEIVKNEAYGPTIVPAQARTRLDVLAHKTGAVYFAPAPVVQTPAQTTLAPAAEPVIEAVPVEIPAAPQVPAAEVPAPAAAEAPTPTPAPTPAPAPAEQQP
jgi:tetratricopeptide (TPR) repeat protein